jgi:hypothetical protein
LNIRRELRQGTDHSGAHQAVPRALRGLLAPVRRRPWQAGERN